MTNYGKLRYERIADINFEPLDSLKLEGEDSMKLLEYYKQKYNIAIKKEKQPVLIAEEKVKGHLVYLVPELMRMTGIPDTFDESRRKKISESTIKEP